MRIKCFSRFLTGAELSHNRKEPGSIYTSTRDALMYFREIGFLPLTGLRNRFSNKLR